MRAIITLDTYTNVGQTEEIHADGEIFLDQDGELLIVGTEEKVLAAYAIRRVISARFEHDKADEDTATQTAGAHDFPLKPTGRTVC